MNCLVTGVTGFVGANLARRLHRAGWSVRAITRRGDPVSALPFVQVVGSSISRESVSEAMLVAKPDVVFHLAAEVLVQHEPTDTDRLLDANIRFALHLLEAMRTHGCRAMVNASTGWQHYLGSDYDPVCLYAATKQAAEDLMVYYANACGMRICSLVLLDNYGPSDTRRKLFYWLKRSLDSAEPIAFSDGEQPLDLVHIDDVTRAFELAGNQALHAESCGHSRFRVGSQFPIKVKDIAAEFERLAGKSLNISWGARPRRERELTSLPEKPPMLPGWSADVDLEQGIRQMVHEALGSN